MTFKKIILMVAIISAFIIGATGLPSAQAEEASTQAAKARPVYLVTQINIVDQEKYFHEYVPELSKYLRLGNGKVLLATKKPAAVLEGKWAHNWNMVVKFPSAADFDKFYLSEGYQKIAKPLRLGATDMNTFVLFENGLDDDEVKSEEGQTSVYFMAKLKIHDRKTFFGPYVTEVRKHVGAGGGKGLFGGFTPKTLEGDWGNYWSVFIKFASKEGFDKYYHSEGNLKVAMPIRFEATSENNTVMFKESMSPSHKRKTP